MDKNVKKVNDILVNLFNMVLKLEEEALQESLFKDLSITEAHTLVAIGKGRPKTMTHVANLLGINVSTLTTAINKLVKKGYVERLRDEEDRRIVRIHLTDDGIEAVKAHESFHEDMIREALSHVPEEELPKFISSIDNMHKFLMMRSAISHAKRDEYRLEPLKLGNYQLPVPIVQAGMSIGIAGSSLAAAVAIEGGLGLIGTSEIGYRSEGYEEDRLQANLDTLEKEIKTALKKVQKAKGKGLIGVSIMWNRPEAHLYAETAVKAGAQVIVTSAGIPKDLPKYCGKKAALVPTISSRRAASAIIRTWTQKFNRVPDGFIFQGPLAAGLLGFKEAQLEKAEKERFDMIADVRAELVNLENCPLFAGGGIYTREDAEDVYKAGADGILMGTRFVVTEECDADEEYKNLYLNCTGNDVTIIKSPMKTSLRTMKSSFAEKTMEPGGEEYDLIEAVKKAVEGDHDNGLVFCSVNADKINRISTVKDVFEEFTR